MEKTSDGSYVKDGKVVWEPKSEKIKESCKNRAEEFDLRRQTIDDANPCLEVKHCHNYHLDVYKKLLSYNVCRGIDKATSNVCKICNAWIWHAKFTKMIYKNCFRAVTRLEK